MYKIYKIYLRYTKYTKYINIKNMKYINIFENIFLTNIYSILLSSFFVESFGDLWDSPPSPASMSKFPSGGNRYEKTSCLCFVEFVCDFLRSWGTLGVLNGPHPQRQCKSSLPGNKI